MREPAPARGHAPGAQPCAGSRSSTECGFGDSSGTPSAPGTPDEELASDPSVSLAQRKEDLSARDDEAGQSPLAPVIDRALGNGMAFRESPLRHADGRGLFLPWSCFVMHEGTFACASACNNECTGSEVLFSGQGVRRFEGFPQPFGELAGFSFGA